jgi:glycosyltransferase involved in cell wall biosynthesis
MKNNNVKISLIVCAYNEEKYLGDCLDCAIKNSEGRFYEIIVIDNASTDKTKEIALARPGVRVVRENQKGLTRARERGYQEATGNILAYIDADTRMPEGWVDRVVEEFEKNDELACLSGPYVYYDISKAKSLSVKAYWYLLATPMYWIVGYMTVGGNFVIRKDILEKMDGFDTTIEFYGEDTNIARRAHAFGKVKFMPSHYMYTSGRRLEKQGIASTCKEYTKNFLSEVLLHKSVTKEYKDLR